MSSKQDYQLEVMISGSKDAPPISSAMKGIPYDSIMKLEVTESVLTLLPRIELVVSDMGSFMDTYPIMDKDVLHVKFNSSLGDPLTEVYATFIISAVHILSDSVENHGNYVKIVGYMAANQAFSPFAYNSVRGSSDLVIRKTAMSMGLKFMSDVVGVENNNWYQNGNKYQFIRHVANRAYVPNDGVFVYGTLDGTIHYTSYNVRSVVPIRFTAEYNRSRVQNNVLNPIADAMYMYYDGYELVDINEIYNNKSNYGGVYTKYDLLRFGTLPLGPVSKTTAFLNKKATYYGQPTFSDNFGVVGDKTIQNTIYNGKLQNTFTKYHLFSNSISLNINNSTNVSLFDNVDLNLKSTFDRETVADPYSGKYMVTSISHSLVANAGYTKRILVCRHGINQSFYRKDYAQAGVI